MDSPLINSLKPIIGDAPKILILGSMAGRESLCKNEYYAYPQNRFWKIMFEYFAAPFSTDYSDRLSLLENNGIALWDSICSCERENSSLDSKIKRVIPNDIPLLLKTHPTISHIITNGKKSESVFRQAYKNIQYFSLPSTSAANAAMSYSELFSVWSKALTRLLQD